MDYTEVKRIIDIFLSIFLAILFLPVWFIIPILILIDSGWPIFYRHRRVGKDGKEFWLYKFRTMVPDADKILFSNKKLLAEFKNGDWKLKHDPRITKLGKVIRNLTIDEFPQLVNVLRGDMSIVGPRAYVKQEINEQTRKHPKTKKMMKEILSVKPGITGPWQTSGRNVIPFPKRAKMDNQYSRNRSFWQDLMIIIKTPKAMISKW